MARPTEWRRTRHIGQVSPASVVANERPIAVFEGETVGRIHLHYQVLYSPPVPLAPFGVEGVLGVRVQNDLNTVPDLSPLDDISDEAWMWHEGFGPTAQIFDYRPSNDSEVQVYTAPTDGGYRDIRAQRQVLADGAIWVQASTAFMASNVGNFYLQFTIAALILLPA